MANEQFNLDELFNEIDKKKFLIHFEYFIKHEEKWSDINGKRLNINDIVTKITENLLNNVCLSGFKYEKLLLKLPWQKYLFNIDDDDDNGDDNEEKSLRPEIFINFIAEYIRIFPNRCEKFLDDFLFFLRGNTLHKASESNEIVKIQDKELQLFNCFKQTIQTLIINVKNLEFILTRLMKKRYPFIHNSIVHEFQCYAYNIINFIELLSHDNAIDLLDFLFQKLLEIDLEQFFNEFIQQNKENNHIFEIEIDSIVVDHDQERFKKLKILDSILDLLFDHIDDRIKYQEKQQQQQEKNDNDENEHRWDKMIQILTTIFFQRILSSDSIHCQYLLFYICSHSESYCNILVSDLWTLLSTPQTPIIIRQSSLNIIISLFLNGRFININSIFSLLKLILQSLNNYLHSNNQSIKANLNENDLIYYQLCIGFCQLFCIFHNDFNRNQIDCLKNLDMKRAIITSNYKPLQYVSLELGEHFLHLCNYYRIGYVNIADIQHHTLQQTFSQYRSKTCYFGGIYLKTIKNRISIHVNDMETLSNGTNENIGYRIHDESMVNCSRKNGSNYQQQKTMMMLSQSPNFTTTTSDDGMTTTSPTESGINNSLISKFIMNHMLSDDCETME
ncbi:DNA independent RNA polymerase I transcription factor [Dermatophagoides pteronyssinus]|uniref:DNA independent RNA polymerase I transcription factor n=1 Tax=Dermatophagoides pteronyssinus TaxID=6956 RepID=A0ABQ8J150_DERPT|nr:DNA independent RNA polymerase I transcription factor [Dermatophagoides pteronyssinus]